jgi:hypothetical protein
LCFLKNRTLLPVSLKQPFVGPCHGNVDEAPTTAMGGRLGEKILRHKPA